MRDAGAPETKERRCPRLGHEITFAYCLGCGDDGGPCFKVADCWWEYFDVVDYLRAHYDEETVARILDARPKPKVASLLELIEQAKERTGQKE
ncbi:MAG: hypothetical protein SWH68_14920 [Thermodesulfobacteriota bacterium]|nr:hypothetical protein [Thermodesulfobacteriota bacterium]